MPEIPSVTVLVSPELIAQMNGEWSAPVQVQIVETPGVGTGWEMTCRTYTPNAECEQARG